MAHRAADTTAAPAGCGEGAGGEGALSVHELTAMIDGLSVRELKAMIERAGGAAARPGG